MDKKEYLLKAVDQLEEFGFLKTVDRVAEYSANADLYFKKIDEQRYIVFHHYHKNKKEELQGFDCWVSTYEREYHIGKVHSIEMEGVKASFDFLDDWKLIAAFLF